MHHLTSVQDPVLRRSTKKKNYKQQKERHMKYKDTYSEQIKTYQGAISQAKYVELNK